MDFKLFLTKSLHSAVDYQAAVDFGNFNSGVIGKALGLSDWELLSGAGATARKDSPDRQGYSPWGSALNWDQPRDEVFIRMGIQWHNNGHSGK